MKNKDIMDKYYINNSLRKVTVEEIEEAEKKLKLKFPNEYLEYLREYSTGEFNSDVIYGLGVDNNKHPSVIFSTEEYRNYDKQINPCFIVIYEDGGETTYFLECQNLKDIKRNETGKVFCKNNNSNKLILKKTSFELFIDYLLVELPHKNSR